ncbi:hypothetical protein [Nocardia thailandica]|uniref:hypothetical protein n=1 Tax=Nocardia thailandica TaxID=257275 RepID=UPI0002F467FC|nr:hypothetical protein [Nocardia thailandica]
MSTPPAAWAVPGTTVFELHRSSRDYSVKKTTPTTVDRIESDRIVLGDGACYYLSEATDIEPVTYLRDDPANTGWYFMLVGPDHPSAPR